MRQALRNRAVQGLEEKARSSEKKVELVAGIEGLIRKSTVAFSNMLCL